MSILKVFNSQFNEFLNDIHNVFPDDANVKTAKFYLNKVTKVNPSLSIKAWYEYVTKPYNNEIKTGDFSFFLSKDYKADLGTSDNYDSDSIMGAIQMIKEKAQLMSYDNKDKTIKYIQNLSKLSDMYRNT